jgi:hypothetical protein
MCLIVAGSSDNPVPPAQDIPQQYATQLWVTGKQPALARLCAWRARRVPAAIDCRQGWYAVCIVIFVTPRHSDLACRY